jgi:hypothetical protein
VSTHRASAVAAIGATPRIAAASAPQDQPLRGTQWHTLGERVFQPPQARSQIRVIIASARRHGACFHFVHHEGIDLVHRGENELRRSTSQDRKSVV